MKNNDLIQVYLPQIEKFTLVSLLDYSDVDLKHLSLHLVLYCWKIFSNSEIDKEIDINDLDLLCNPLFVSGIKLPENWKVIRKNVSVEYDIHLTMELRSYPMDIPYSDSRIEDFYKNRNWSVWTPREGIYYRNINWEKVAHLEDRSSWNTDHVFCRLLVEYAKLYPNKLKLVNLDAFVLKYFYRFIIMKPFHEIEIENRFKRIDN